MLTSHHIKEITPPPEKYPLKNKTFLPEHLNVALLFSYVSNTGNKNDAGGFPLGEFVRANRKKSRNGKFFANRC